jgi:predicted O-methyltransferase YrrM
MGATSDGEEPGKFIIHYAISVLFKNIIQQDRAINMGKFKNIIKTQVNKLPYIKTLHEKGKNSQYPNGHFYSPVISIEDIKQRASSIWKNIDVVPGIELFPDAQKQLVNQLSVYYNELPFKPQQQPGVRYYFENGFYSYTDGIILYSMIRHYKPKRIIEIGSGFSSALMLDTSELFFDDAIKIICIEPYPERLYSLMKKDDAERLTIIEKDAQLIELSVFEELEAGDILFIDSTHVAKTGSDVNYILFEILPLLKKGVFIHFHDVFYPFEYPQEWVFAGFNWNEDYILRSFLMYNEKFVIKLFADYLHKKHSDCYINMPLTYKNTGGNLWLQKQ